jgi:hypothetical protein
MININDVIEIDDKRKKIKKDIYKKIYDQFSAKIKQCVELGHKQVFLSVPVILIGYPVFDRSAAARYIARQFELGGFIVQLVGEYDVYVSWNIQKKKRVQETDEEGEIEFPNLMNLKKMANKYRESGA